MQSSAPSSGRQGRFRKFIKIRKKIRDAQNKVKGAGFCFSLLATQPVLGNTASDQVTEEETDQVTEEETDAAFVYQMHRLGRQANDLRVEIRWGNALWVIGQGDEPIKVELQKNREMRLSEAMASMNADGVLTVVIPKRIQPRKWYEFEDLAFNMFRTFCVEISQS